MKILDLSAGNRAVWFDKDNPLATYLDIRPEVNPTHVVDTRAIPDTVGSGFDLFVFDPPHKNNGATGGMKRVYGHFTAAQIESTIIGTARESHRIGAPNALMAFKWNDHSKKLESVLSLLAPWWVPLFGHGVCHQQRNSATSWVMLLRNAEAKP